MKGEFAAYVHGTKNVGRLCEAVARNFPKQALVFFSRNRRGLGVTIVTKTT